MLALRELSRRSWEVWDVANPEFYRTIQLNLGRKGPNGKP